MEDQRAQLTRQVLDLQAALYRSLHPTREWFEADLTMAQLKVLFLVAVEGSATMTRLASTLGVTLGTVTGIVDRLVDHGLVKREGDPNDRRLVLCCLTARGWLVAERLHQAGTGSLADALDSLSMDDLRTVAAALAVLCDAAHGGAIVPLRADAPTRQPAAALVHGGASA
ncbi:MAG TPA: MarR family transcriptional regulator [Chloroflexota bacterium]